MGDEINDNSNNVGEFKRRRPIPIPVFSDRYIERPYMRKEELSLIRNAVEELVDIKVGKDNDIPVNTKINDAKVVTSDSNILKAFPSDVSKNITSDTFKPEVINDDDNKGINTKVIETKISDIKIPDIKIGIGNLVENKVEKKIENKVEKKSKSKKVINVNDVEQVYNISPEMRKQIRKSEIEDYHNEKEVQDTIRKAALLAEQNSKELKEFKLNLSKENEEIRKDLKNEFGNKFNELSGRFTDITGKFDGVNTKFDGVNTKFDGVSKKLEETCTGIDCLKKDLANINKNMDLVECPDCNKKIVPPLSSYCPNCNAKMSSWFEDDGVTPVKGWKPSWEK